MTFPDITTLRPAADDVPSIRDAIARAEDAQRLAQQRAEHLGREHVAAMLTGTNDELRAMEASAADANLYAERIALLLPQLAEALAEAQRREQVAAANALRQENAAAVEALRRRLQNGELLAAAALIIDTEAAITALGMKLKDARQHPGVLTAQPGELVEEGPWPHEALATFAAAVAWPITTPVLQHMARTHFMRLADEATNRAEEAARAERASQREAAARLEGGAREVEVSALPRTEQYGAFRGGRATH